MTHYFKSASSINAQIRDTEQQLFNHQRAVNSHANVLTGKVKQHIAVNPATLLLAVGIGFIAGELTLPRCSKAGMAQATETPPLKTALNLFASARTLYAALPLLMIIQSRYQAIVAEQDTGGNDAKPRP